MQDPGKTEPIQNPLTLSTVAADGRVGIAFNRPTNYITMSPEDALTLSRALKLRAKEARQTQPKEQADGKPN